MTRILSKVNRLLIGGRYYSFQLWWKFISELTTKVWYCLIKWTCSELAKFFFDRFYQFLLHHDNANASMMDSHKQKKFRCVTYHEDSDNVPLINFTSNQRQQKVATSIRRHFMMLLKFISHNRHLEYSRPTPSEAATFNHSHVFDFNSIIVQMQSIKPPTLMRLQTN